MEWVLEGVIVLLQLSTIAIIWRDHRGRVRSPKNRLPPRVPTR
jgi:hypothetical protein